MIKKLIHLNRLGKNNCLKSTVTRLSSSTSSQKFRTSENDPGKHNNDLVGHYYTISPDDKKIFFSGGLPKSYEIQTETFQETCLMIRKPSVYLIDCLKTIDYSQPLKKFVLYGQKGNGKSLSLAHVLHYCYKSGFLLVHVPWVGNWMRRCKESSNSETHEGLIDINLDAAAWLLHFKNQNEAILSGDLKTSQDYKWTKRETTPKNSNLREIIDFGINRIKFASNCIIALSNEIKHLSREGKIKTLVAIDGFNAFFYPKTRIRNDKKEIVHPKNITITEAFLNLTKADWNNSVAVLIVDEIAIGAEDQLSHFPRYLLGKEGFEHLDPFIPVFVDKYSSKELVSCLDYYRERRWIVPEAGQDEQLSFLAASNPYKLMQLCKSL